MENNLPKVNQKNCINELVSYNLDHLYCHTNDNNFSNTNSTHDLMSIIKEIKQLKSMLLLHLDLIQEQSDQIQTKDKVIIKLKQENESLKTKLDRMDRRMHGRQSKRDDFQQENVEFSKDPLDSNANTKRKDKSEVSKKNNKLTIHSFTTPQKEPEQKYKYKAKQSVQNDSSNSSGPIFDNYIKNESVIGENNGQLITKIVLQRIQPMSNDLNKIKSEILNNNNADNSANDDDEEEEDDEDDEEEDDEEEIDEDNETLFEIQTKTLASQCTATTKKSVTIDSTCPKETAVLYVPPADKISDTTTKVVAIKSPQIVSEDQKQICERPTKNVIIEVSNTRLSPIKIENNTNDDENLLLSPRTCDNYESDRISNYGEGSKSRKRSFDEDSSSNQNTKKKMPRNNFMVTRKEYITREWTFEDIDEEIGQMNKSTRLKDDEINLEIPKWTVKEYTGCYSIEGTEDLSDEVFLKRHQKLEIDEKRRKKWDVQRIREQRTIERLKRRHCKQDIIENVESVETDSNLFSFFPTSDSIKFIEITDELPIQAFGETIPLLPPSEFTLPWSCYNSSMASPSLSYSTIALTKSRTIRRNLSLSGRGGIKRLSNRR